MAPVVHLVPVAVVAEAEGAEEDTQGEAEVAVEEAEVVEEAAVLVQVALPAQALGAAEKAAEAAVAVLEVLPSCSHRCRLCWLHRRLAPRGSRWQKPVG